MAQVLAWLKRWNEHIPPQRESPIAYHVQAGSRVDMHTGLEWWMPHDTEVVPLVAASEVESLERDAARYRWLQEHTVATGLSRWMGRHQFLDAAIDAAIAQQRGEDA